jgi:hypothetical protein
MPDAARCPMCGQDHPSEVPERICGVCRMGIPMDRRFFVVVQPGRVATLCSRGCVRSHVLMARTV